MHCILLLAKKFVSAYHHSDVILSYYGKKVSFEDIVMGKPVVNRLYIILADTHDFVPDFSVNSA